MRARARIAACAAALLLAAGCGDSEQVSTNTTAGDPTGTTGASTTTTEPGTASDDLAERVARAAERVEEVGSGRFVMTVQMSGFPEVGDVEMRMEGEFNAEGQAYMRMDLSSFFEAAQAADPDAVDDPFADAFAGMFSDPIEIVVDGDTTYMKMAFLTTLVGADTPWVSTPTEGSDASDITGFGLPGGNDPTELLDALEDIGAEVESLGTEEVNGVEAHGYRVVIDLTQAADALGDGADLEALPDEVLEQGLPMEIWLTEDGLPVRFSMTFDEELMAAFDETGELIGASMTVEMDFTDLGEPVEIAIPDPSEVTPLDDLGGMFGGFGEGDGSGLGGGLGNR